MIRTQNPLKALQEKKEKEAAEQRKRAKLSAKAMAFGEQVST